MAPRRAPVYLWVLLLVPHGNGTFLVQQKLALPPCLKTLALSIVRRQLPLKTLSAHRSQHQGLTFSSVRNPYLLFLRSAGEPYSTL